VTTELHAVTGATGLLGSHVAELLVARGLRVRALVRAGSDSSFLRRLGVEVVPGSLDESASLVPFVSGAAVVYHCAARVGDWGPWSLYRQAVVEATGRLLAACRDAGVGRFLHVSSLNVYGHPRLREDEWLEEDRPLGQRLWWADHYCRAKILAEEQVRAYPGTWTIVRPGWMFGPRDRNTLPRVIARARQGRIVLVGPGDNRINVLHAADVAEGVVRAAAHPQAVGQAYNLSSEVGVRQRDMLDAITDALGLPRVRRHVPFPLAFAAAFVMELAGWALRLRSPPPLTRYAVALIGRGTRFRIDKARRELGWWPRIDPLDGLRQTLAELVAHERASGDLG
jgi:nucleoside-diphosphate-sugar epimerase